MDFLIVMVLGIVSILLLAIPIVRVRDQWWLCRSLPTFPLELARMQLRYSRRRMLYWLASLLLWDITACFAIIFYHFPRGLPFPLTLLVLIIINICCLVVITAHYQISRLARQRVKALEAGDNQPGRGS